MKVLNYILGMACVYTSLWLYEKKYVWMNEAPSLFAKEGSLVEVPYVEPSFLGSLYVNSVIPKFHCIWTNNMKNVMCYMQYVMCYVLDVMCCVQYDKYYDACYSHGMTSSIQIWQVLYLS